MTGGGTQVYQWHVFMNDVKLLDPKEVILGHTITKYKTKSQNMSNPLLGLSTLWT